MSTDLATALKENDNLHILAEKLDAAIGNEDGNEVDDLVHCFECDGYSLAQLYAVFPELAKFYLKEESEELLDAARSYNKVVEDMLAAGMEAPVPVQITLLGSEP